MGSGNEDEEESEEEKKRETYAEDLVKRRRSHR